MLFLGEYYLGISRLLKNKGRIGLGRIDVCT